MVSELGIKEEQGGFGHQFNMFYIIGNTGRKTESDTINNMFSSDFRSSNITAVVAAVLCVLVFH